MQRMRKSSRQRRPRTRTTSSCLWTRATSEEVGEGGGLLSVGQKQLVSIARALLADPDILILDEATSSVDTLTEAAIQSGLVAVMAGRTTFVIAHRLSTIKGADRILVIRDGGIAEMGSHPELIEARDHYYDLYTRQFRRDREVVYGVAEGSAPTRLGERGNRPDLLGYPGRQRGRGSLTDHRRCHQGLQAISHCCETTQDGLGLGASIGAQVGQRKQRIEVVQRLGADVFETGVPARYTIGSGLKGGGCLQVPVERK